MRTITPDHPKAAIMAQKRADILAAAKASFLATGYEGTSMDSIASAANVSIMTLYRHARTKDDLFSAVIANACDPSDEGEQAWMAALLAKPFGQALVDAAMKVQQRLTESDTIALMRTVIAGAARFPVLAENTYKGLIGGQEEMMVFILSCRPETASLEEERRRALARQFVDGLVGTDMLSVLMGLAVPADEALRRRASNASAAVVAAIGARST